MRKSFLILFLGVVLNAYELYDFYSCKKTGEFKFRITEMTDGVITKKDSLFLKIISYEDGRMFQFQKNGKIDYEMLVDENDIPTAGYTYIKNKKIQIRDENLTIRNESKLFSKKIETLKLNNKTFNTTRYVYKEDSKNLVTKDDLLLKTLIKITWDIWKDTDGLPIKIEKRKDIIQRTVNINKPDKVLKETKKVLKEIIELE